MNDHRRSCGEDVWIASPADYSTSLEEKKARHVCTCTFNPLLAVAILTSDTAAAYTICGSCNGDQSVPKDMKDHLSLRYDKSGRESNGPMPARCAE